MELDEARVDTVALKGLALLRKSMTGVVQGEQHRLHEAKHDYYKNADITANRLVEEKDHLKFVQSKVDIKATSLRQFIEQLDKAKEILQAAKFRVRLKATKEEQKEISSYVEICESLVTSWEISVDLAKQRLHCWEFKHKRQTAIIAKLTAELVEAESQYRDVSEQLNLELDSLKAVSELLRQL